ncbi:MAG: YgjV family protein [Clostridia bacterium]|nr:YgjV family protein [Clostridia bacterium]
MFDLIVGQFFGIVAMVGTFISYQANTKQRVLIVQTLATILTCASYYFLDAKSGMVLNVIAVLRNVIFYFQKEGTKLSYITAFTLAGIMTVFGALSWQGWFSILVIVALAANTVFLSLGNPQLLRKSILVTSTMVLIYNCFVLSLGGIANEAIAIISSIIGIIRYVKLTKKQDKTENALLK